MAQKTHEESKKQSSNNMSLLKIRQFIKEAILEGKGDFYGSILSSIFGFFFSITGLTDSISSTISIPPNPWQNYFWRAISLNLIFILLSIFFITKFFKNHFFTINPLASQYPSHLTIHILVLIIGFFCSIFLVWKVGTPLYQLLNLPSENSYNIAIIRTSDDSANNATKSLAKAFNDILDGKTIGKYHLLTTKRIIPYPKQALDSDSLELLATNLGLSAVINIHHTKDGMQVTHYPDGLLDAPSFKPKQDAPSKTYDPSSETWVWPEIALMLEAVSLSQCDTQQITPTLKSIFDETVAIKRATASSEWGQFFSTHPAYAACLLTAGIMLNQDDRELIKATREITLTAIETAKTNKELSESAAFFLRVNQQLPRSDLDEIKDFLKALQTIDTKKTSGSIMISATQTILFDTLSSMLHGQPQKGLEIAKIQQQIIQSNPAILARTQLSYGQALFSAFHNQITSTMPSLITESIKFLGAATAENNPPCVKRDAWIWLSVAYAEPTLSTLMSNPTSPDEIKECSTFSLINLNTPLVVENTTVLPIGIVASVPLTTNTASDKYVVYLEYQNGEHATNNVHLENKPPGSNYWEASLPIDLPGQQLPYFKGKNKAMFVNDYWLVIENETLKLRKELPITSIFHTWLDANWRDKASDNTHVINSAIEITAALKISYSIAGSSALPTVITQAVSLTDFSKAMLMSVDTSPGFNKPTEMDFDGQTMYRSEHIFNKLISQTLYIRLRHIANETLFLETQLPNPGAQFRIVLPTPTPTPIPTPDPRPIKIVSLKPDSSKSKFEVCTLALVHSEKDNQLDIIWVDSGGRPEFATITRDQIVHWVETTRGDLQQDRVGITLPSKTWAYTTDSSDFFGAIPTSTPDVTKQKEIPLCAIAISKPKDRNVGRSVDIYGNNGNNTEKKTPLYASVWITNGNFLTATLKIGLDYLK